MPSQGPRTTVGTGPGLTVLQLKGTGKTSIQASAERAEESLTSPKADRNEALGMVSPPNLSVMQFPSASVAPVQSLTLQTPPRSGVSPIPPASLVDLAKYNDTKLFFFLA